MKEEIIKGKTTEYNIKKFFSQNINEVWSNYVYDYYSIRNKVNPGVPDGWNYEKALDNLVDWANQEINVTNMDYFLDEEYENTETLFFPHNKWAKSYYSIDNFFDKNVICFIKKGKKISKDLIGIDLKSYFISCGTLLGIKDNNILFKRHSIEYEIPANNVKVIQEQEIKVKLTDDYRNSICLLENIITGDYWIEDQWGTRYKYVAYIENVDNFEIKVRLDNNKYIYHSCIPFP